MASESSVCVHRIGPHLHRPAAQPPDALRRKKAGFLSDILPRWKEGMNKRTLLPCAHAGPCGQAHHPSVPRLWQEGGLRHEGDSLGDIVGYRPGTYWHSI